MLQDFGVTARYRAAATGTQDLLGIYDNAYEAVDAGGTVSFAMQQPRFTCRTADIPSAAEGDTMTLDGQQYIVRIVMPDGTGITELMLERQ